MAAAEDSGSKKASKKQGKSAKKGGKGKWFLFLLLVLILSAGATYYFQPKIPGVAVATSFIDKNINRFWPGKGSKASMEDELKPEDLSQSMLQLEREHLMQEQKKAATEMQPSKSYYVKVEDCVNLTCQQEVARFLKQERLPYTQRQKTRHARYYELISSSVYTRTVARAKIDLLKMQPEVKGEPYLVKENNRYKVSLGQYPKEDTGVRVKAELVNLYPKLKIDFELRPKLTYYKVNSYYAGPFKKSTAESVLRKLKDNPEYEDSEITRNL